MLFDLHDYGAGDTLPTDVTLRTPIYRRHGIIASLCASAFAAIATRVRTTERKRRASSAPPLSDHLKRDIGLAIESSRSPVWEDIRWK